MCLRALGVDRWLLKKGSNAPVVPMKRESIRWRLHQFVTLSSNNNPICTCIVSYEWVVMYVHVYIEGLINGEESLQHGDT